jgi:hypothetical protein
MGGVRTFLALILALGVACAPAQADVRALVSEKAAAVSIMREKAASQIANLAQDRVFGAFLNATTQGESVRLRRRIEAAFSTILKRFGLREVTLIARDGTIAAHAAGRSGAGIGDVQLLNDAALTTGFALDAMKAATLVTADGDNGGYAISHVSPVVWHDNKEFVLRGEQGLGAYKAVLKSGVGDGRYVALIDQTRSILSEAGTHPGGRDASGKLSVAGLSFDGLRRALKGTAKEGYGEVGGAKKRLSVGYRAVGPWVVVAVEAAPLARRCPGNGARLCG